MNNPLISVIVPVYKVEPYLDRCVASVLDQDYTHFELILVDDGSPDECGKMCDGWAKKDSRICVYHKSNGGLSSARNYGLDRSRGDYIAFIDSDDWVTPDYLSYMLSLYSGHIDCAVVACNHCIVREDRKSSARDQVKEIEAFSREEAFEQVLFHGTVDVSAWAKLYKKEVFADLRYPEGRLFEDTWLFGDILKKTNVIMSGNRCCYYYGIRNNSIANGSFKKQNLQFIEAAEKLARDAVEFDPGNETGGLRRINHARLSVLRYMERCDAEYIPVRHRLRQAILADAPRYIRDPRTPKRDRLAVLLLRMGFPTFYGGWNLYTRMRA